MIGKLTNKNIRNTRTYRISLWLALVVCAVVIWSLGERVMMQPRFVIGQDYAQIWAAGRLILSGQNPYDPALIEQLKLQITGDTITPPEVTSIFYSPPWTLPLAMLLGWPPYLPGRITWLILNIVVLFFCAGLLWKVYEGDDRRWISWLAVFSLGPTYMALAQGQTTPLVLLGIAGFLYWIERCPNDWLAGLCIVLVSIKPQLFYLFWFALLFWIISRRRWKLLLVGIGIGLAATAVGMIFNPRLIHEYIESYVSYSPLMWKSPTIGYYLRLFFGVQKFSLQYVPAIFGLCWFFWYWMRRRRNWIWSEEIPLLIFVSLITTPFGWTYDEILLIVPLMPAWILLFVKGDRKVTVILLAIYAVINLSYLILHRYFTDEFYIWLVPALFLWWWYVMTTRHGPGFSQANNSLTANEEASHR